jgi:hypothetical protein
MAVSSDRAISLLFSDVGLANVLRDRVVAATGRRVVVLDELNGSLSRLGILVTSTTQCSPAECAGIAEAGVRVIILAAVPSDFQRGLYESAGAAAYLPMALDLDPLFAAIARIEAAAA